MNRYLSWQQPTIMASSRSFTQLDMSSQVKWIPCMDNSVNMNDVTVIIRYDIVLLYCITTGVTDWHWFIRHNYRNECRLWAFPELVTQTAFASGKWTWVDLDDIWVKSLSKHTYLLIRMKLKYHKGYFKSMRSSYVFVTTSCDAMQTFTWN